MTPARCPRAGFTLVELMVAMAVMGVALSVATGAIVAGLDANEAVDAWTELVRQRRSEAIAEGRPAVVWPDSAHVERPTLVLPDGRVVGGSSPWDRPGDSAMGASL